MHFDGNTSFLECGIVRERALNRIYGIILVLQQECGWGPVVNVTSNIWVQAKVIVACRQVSRIEGYGEIRTATPLVGCIHGRRRFSKWVLIAATMCPPASGTFAGHIAICVCPAEGCQLYDWETTAQGERARK